MAGSKEERLLEGVQLLEGVSERFLSFFLKKKTKTKNLLLQTSNFSVSLSNKINMTRAKIGC